MTAYVISDVTIRDRAAAETYRARTARSIQHYGGRYLTRAGAVQPLKGDWRPRAITVVEFPSMVHARTWYASPEYASALALRDQALSGNLILVKGTGLKAEVPIG